MYRVVGRFMGLAENRYFEVGDEYDFTADRAIEIVDKLGNGFLQKIETVPNDSNSVAEIKEWLDNHAIEYQSTMLKADLLALVNDTDV
ncbi:hypothetical protein [Leuconostoc mesenteroides]|uniref:hypothetical protein n=1 Tax=Leuconostoc mesenteroides TaxID=1245 RepID=UPI00376F8123